MTEAAVRERLIYLQNKHGQITPQIVVDDAKTKESPLHGKFDWNVRSAAMKHWLHTARELIQRVNLISSESETITIKAPYYVRDPSVAANEQGYVSVAQLLKDPSRARESLRLEFGRAEGALTRARAVASALNMEGEVEAMIVQLVRMTDRLSAA